MKKLLIVIGFIGLLSCGKKYHCTCYSYSPTQSGMLTNQRQYTYRKFSKDAAKDECEKTYRQSAFASATINCTVY